MLNVRRVLTNSPVGIRPKKGQNYHPVRGVFSSSFAPLLMVYDTAVVLGAVIHAPRLSPPTHHHTESLCK